MGTLPFSTFQHKRIVEIVNKHTEGVYSDEFITDLQNLMDEVVAVTTRTVRSLMEHD